MSKEINEKLKALKLTIDKIDKDFGKGSVMMMNERGEQTQEVISTGSIGLDTALGIGGLPRGRIIERTWNAPVAIDGVTVEPGDLVIADGSGIVFVPRACAEEVIALAEGICARERQMAHAARRGEPMSQVMGANYEQMLKKDAGS